MYKLDDITIYDLEKEKLAISKCSEKGFCIIFEVVWLPLLCALQLVNCYQVVMS